MSFEITERWLSEIAGWQVTKPAKTLVSGGAVLKADFDGRVLRGLVMDGRKRLACGLKIEGATDVTNLCGCQTARSTGAICSHSVAAGLIYLQRQAEQRQRTSMAERETPVHAEMPEIRSQGSDGSHLIPVLGVDWIENLKSGNFVTECSGSAVGQSIARLGGGAIIDALRGLGQSRVSERLSVPVGKGGPLFQAIANHPELRCGKVAIRVASSIARLLVRIRSAGSEQVSLELMTKGEPVLLGDAQWWWSAGGGDSEPLLSPIEVPIEFTGLLAKR